jgi:hypothetical protein
MDTATILWSLLFGAIGMGYFIYGKRQAQVVIRYTGLALMLFPYVVSDTVVMVIIGVLLLILPRFIKL